jgi:glucan 1,3-beta-glucosidase
MSSSLSSGQEEKRWIRGVNVGGWLMAERFITPYLFAVNSCHMAGDLCWYPGQIGMPNTTSATTMCDPKRCTPVRPLRVMDGNADYHPRNAQPYNDFPIDEYTLGQTFVNRATAKRYMERHWDTFVSYQDLVDLRDAGVTHLRVPLSYWIRGDVRAGEPWITGGWPYFVRMAKWCREIGGLQIWVDLHGAPGSENGFDNSGQYLGRSSCSGWSNSAENVERTVNVVTDIAHAIADEEGLTDVVTGFGLLNEPFLDCDQEVLRNYYTQGFKIVRSVMGNDTSVFIGDMFRAQRFNNGWWTDDDTHYKTYLDSHPYHVFFEKGRAFTPRQHIAYVCRHGHQETVGCCYEDAPTNTVPSKGISRIIGEWSAAYDALPTALAPFIMKTIAATGQATYLNRTLSADRMDFIRNFVEAQVVAYEARDEGVASGWLFWNFKMEYVYLRSKEKYMLSRLIYLSSDARAHFMLFILSICCFIVGCCSCCLLARLIACRGGAFAEWDFLRGIQEGWMPKIPDPTVASEDLYGSCLDIYNRTNDDYNLIIDEYPDPRTLDWTQYQGWDATDDFVLSDPLIPRTNYGPRPWYVHWMVPTFIVLGGLLFGLRRQLRPKRRERIGYDQIK